MVGQVVAGLNVVEVMVFHENWAGGCHLCCLHDPEKMVELLVVVECYHRDWC